MPDLVLVPTFSRPAMLYLALEAIRKADANVAVRVCMDAHTDDGDDVRARQADVPQICERFGAELRARVPHTYHTNTYNFLEAYREAYEEEWRYVYCVEDDVIVAPDFFRWHEAAHKLGKFWCSVGWDCRRNPEAMRGDDAGGVVVTARDYSSIGVCWPRESLRDIVEHATPDYYRSPIPYCATHFDWPEGRRNCWCEQAGLIMHVLMQGGREVAFPVRRRVAHVGWYGYHRPQGERLAGTLADRVERLREAVLRGDNANGDDVDGVLPPAEWTDLHVAQRIK